MKDLFADFLNHCDLHKSNNLQDETDFDSDGLYSIAERSDFSFDSLAGLDDAKSKLSEMLDVFSAKDAGDCKQPPKSFRYLFFGLPGTGKTTLARSLPAKLGIPMLIPSYQSLFHKSPDVTSHRLSQLFGTVSTYETPLLFFDEIDVLTERSPGGNQAHSFAHELIRHIENSFRDKISIVLAATNRPWLIPDNVLHCFDQLIYIPLPDAAARKALVAQQLKNVPVADDIGLNEVSRLLKGFCIADINSVVDRAKSAALMRSLHNPDQSILSAVSMADFTSAASKLKSCIQPEEIEKMRAFASKQNIPIPN